MNNDRKKQLAKGLTKTIMEIVDAGKRLGPGSKKLMVFRNDKGITERYEEKLKLLEIIAIENGFNVQDFDGSKLLTKK